MPDFEICIDKINDNIVSFRDAGKPWGRMERKQPLIIIARNISKEQLFEMCGSTFSNYTTRADADFAVYTFYTEMNKAIMDRSIKDPETGLWVVPPEKQAELLQIKTDILSQYPRPITTDIRRFQIPVAGMKTGWCPTIDNAKLNDDGVDYQPMLDQGIIVDFSEQVAICKDKTTNTFKYSTQKVA